MSNNSLPADQVQGNVDIKRLCKNKYKITFNKIGKFLKYQTSSDTSQPLNESCSAYYQNAKQWVKHFNILNKSNISTAIMEINNNKYLFVIYEAKLNKKHRIVFKVTTKEINFSNDAYKIKIPRGCHDGVRFIIESREILKI